MPELYEFPIYEHYIRFLYGKIIKLRYSIFFLVDYYFRRFAIRDNMINDLNLIFLVLNNENRIFLKITYDIKKNIFIYLKSGYYNEDLFNVSYSLKGWKILLGIGFKK